MASVVKRVLECQVGMRIVPQEYLCVYADQSDNDPTFFRVPITLEPHYIFVPNIDRMVESVIEDGDLSPLFPLIATKSGISSMARFLGSKSYFVGEEYASKSGSGSGYGGGDYSGGDDDKPMEGSGELRSGDAKMRGFMANFMAHIVKERRAMGYFGSSASAVNNMIMTCYCHGKVLNNVNMAATFVARKVAKDRHIIDQKVLPISGPFSGDSSLGLPPFFKQYQSLAVEAIHEGYRASYDKLQITLTGQPTEAELIQANPKDMKAREKDVTEKKAFIQEHIVAHWPRWKDTVGHPHRSIAGGLYEHARSLGVMGTESVESVSGQEVVRKMSRGNVAREIILTEYSGGANMEECLYLLTKERGVINNPILA
jgi:hypothetical protein